MIDGQSFLVGLCCGVIFTCYITAAVRGWHRTKRDPDDLELMGKKVKPIKDAEGNVIDYADVRIRGYLSTFKGTTESNRHGDYVDPGAFTETLKKFMRNPVLLTDHRPRNPGRMPRRSRFLILRLAPRRPAKQ